MSMSLARTCARKNENKRTGASDLKGKCTYYRIPAHIKQMGDVFEAVWKGQNVAVKKFRIADGPPGEVARRQSKFDVELGIMASIGW